MNIDPLRVNILERDIEQWLYENPNAVKFDGGCVEQWTMRQFKLPSGIADLIGINNAGDTVVVEVKNVEITSDALTQVVRYAADLSSIFSDGEWVYRVIIGRGEISERIMFEAEALGISLMTFSVSLDLKIGEQWRWSNKFIESLHKTIREISRCEDIAHHKAAAVFQRDKFIAEERADESAEVEDEAEADNG